MTTGKQPVRKKQEKVIPHPTQTHPIQRQDQVAGEAFGSPADRPGDGQPDDRKAGTTNQPGQGGDQDDPPGAQIVDLRRALEARRRATQQPAGAPDQSSAPSPAAKRTPEPGPAAALPSLESMAKAQQPDGASTRHQAHTGPEEEIARAVRDHPISRLSPQAAVTALLAGSGQAGWSRPDPDHSAPDPDLDPNSEDTLSADPARLFWDIWQDHHAHLRRQSMRLMSGNRADAEDALSTAMLRASQKYAHYAESIINQRAWLTRLLHNACMDHYRGQARRNRLVGDQKDEASEIGHPAIAAEPEHSPEDIALNREALRAVEAQVNNLPPNLRLPFLMRFAQEHSYTEIADPLELTNCAVRKRIQLARERLRQNLEL